MIIKSLEMQEGLIGKSLDFFSAKKNLIFSKKNSQGKSTFLRGLFYSLGYPVPNMKGIDFAKVKTSLVFDENGKTFTVQRDGAALDVMSNGSAMVTYTLPSQHEAFLSYVFGYDKIKVLKNLLGLMYIDQDKGWSLLNRGTVIGKIKFGIEELLAGLNGKDVSGLLEKRKNLDINKARFDSVLNMQKLQEQIYERNQEIFTTDQEKEYLDKISFLKLKISKLKANLKELNSLIQSEKNFFDYIDSMRLFVRYNDDRIPVNRETLDNSFSVQESLKARKSILVMDVERLQKNLDVLNTELSDYRRKNGLSLFELPDVEKDVISRIAQANFNVDQQTLEALIEKNGKGLKDVNENIKSSVKANNPFIKKIYDFVVRYAKDLMIEESIVYKEDYIFTSDLKSYSGAKLQKLVFAFKIAFLKVVEEDMNTHLFLVMDSPRSKELDSENAQLMMNLVKRELSENQVFIASVYDFDVENKIEIKNRAIEKRN